MRNQMLVLSFLTALIAVPAAWTEGLAGTPGGDGRHHVIMHLNSGDEKVQRGALHNIRHLYQDVGREKLLLELVVHGAGLALFTRNATTLGSELAQLKAEYGVAYTACSNTMKAMKITRDDLIGEVGETVPAMVRLMERQEQGWIYIKP